MTLARSKEFAINQGIFHLICKSVDDMNRYHEASVYDEVLEPDDDFRRAITMDKFLIGVKEDLREIFRKGKR